MTEFVYDIAPEAEYYSALSPRSPSVIKNAVDWMVSEGVDVILNPKSDFWDGPATAHRRMRTAR